MGYGETNNGSQVRTLLTEAKRAAAHGGALLDRHDLVELITELSSALEQLVEERNELMSQRQMLAGRLTRSSHVHPDGANDIHPEARHSSAHFLPPDAAAAS